MGGETSSVIGTVIKVTRKSSSEGLTEEDPYFLDDKEVLPLCTIVVHSYFLVFSVGMAWVYLVGAILQGTTRGKSLILCLVDSHR